MVRGRLSAEEQKFQETGGAAKRQTAMQRVREREREQRAQARQAAVSESVPRGLRHRAPPPPPPPICNPVLHCISSCKMSGLAPFRPLILDCLGTVLPGLPQRLRMVIRVALLGLQHPL